MTTHKYSQLLEYIRNCVLHENRLATMVVLDPTTVQFTLHPGKAVTWGDLDFLRALFQPAREPRVVACVGDYGCFLEITVAGLECIIE